MTGTLRDIPLWLMKPFSRQKDKKIVKPKDEEMVKPKDKKMVKLKEGETLTPNGYIQRSLF